MTPTPCWGETSGPCPEPGSALDDRALVFRWRGRGSYDPLFVESGAPADAESTVAQFLESRAPRGERATPLFAPNDPAFAEALPLEFRDRYHVGVESADARRRLAEAIGADPRVADLRRPALFRQLPVHEIDALAGSDINWPLRKCGFDRVWSKLDVGGTPRELAMIDGGMPGLGHRELEGRIVCHQVLRPGAGSPEAHAAPVAAVIAARRGEATGGPSFTDMNGCCSATIRLYDVVQPDGTLHYPGFCTALAEIARDRLPVVNMSIGSWTRDSDVERALAHCRQEGVVLVAAAGNSRGGCPPEYPAASPGVIAVAATDEGNRRIADSSTGQHVFIAAPGIRVRTVSNDVDFRTYWGTSFSAGYVSAAVWLARRQAPGLTPGDVDELLRRSVTSAPAGGRDECVGYGRLDMTELCRLVLGNCA